MFSAQWSGVENGHVCAGDVMRAPKGSVHMANLYAPSLQRLFSEKRVEYGAVGPLLLSEYLLVGRRRGAPVLDLPPTTFNAIDWSEVDLFAAEGRAGFDLLSDPRVAGVHLWGKMWAERGLRFDAVPEQSVAGYLKKLMLEPNWLTQLAAKYDSDKGAVSKGHLAHHYTRDVITSCSDRRRSSPFASWKSVCAGDRSKAGLKIRCRRCRCGWTTSRMPRSSASISRISTGSPIRELGFIASIRATGPCWRTSQAKRTRWTSSSMTALTPRCTSI